MRLEPFPRPEWSPLPFEGCVGVEGKVGERWTSVGHERSQLRAGEFVVWPTGVTHRLWTEGTTMTTLMHEAG